MPQYVLLLHDDPARLGDITPEQMQGVIERYMAWHRKIREAGHAVSGHKLRDGEGRVMRWRDGALATTDGPYAEAREVIGGLFVIKAAGYDDAVRLCADCPHLDFGSIEIREIEPTP
jgi:hypothetical protein